MNAKKVIKDVSTADTAEPDVAFTYFWLEIIIAPLTAVIFIIVSVTCSATSYIISAQFNSLHNYHQNATRMR